MWKLKQIFDGEYGCEERQPGEKEKCLVILANEEGEEKTFEANEDWIAAIEKLSANPLMKIIISKPMAKDCQYKKIVVEKKGDGYQAAKYTEKQVFHDNFGADDLQGYLMEAIHDTFLQVMLMYGKEASNRKQEIDRQHYTIPNQRPKDQHCGKI